MKIVTLLNGYSLIFTLMNTCTFYLHLKNALKKIGTRIMTKVGGYCRHVTMRFPKKGICEHELNILLFTKGELMCDYEL